MDSFVSHAKPARTNLGATVLLNCASTGPKRTARGGIPVPPLNPAVIIPPPLISSLIQLDSHCVASAFLWWTELPLHRQPALATVSCTTLWWYYSEGKCARVLDHAVPSCCQLKHNIVSLLWAISLSFFLKNLLWKWFSSTPGGAAFCWKGGSRCHCGAQKWASVERWTRHELNGNNARVHCWDVSVEALLFDNTSAHLEMGLGWAGPQGERNPPLGL